MVGGPNSEEVRPERRFILQHTDLKHADKSIELNDNQVVCSDMK